LSAYLKEISGKDITAKGFSHWHGTVLAAMALNEFQKFDTQAGAKKNVREAINRVAARLGNTATICRNCYVHPEILTTYVEGSLLLEVKGRVEAELREDLPGLKPEEAAVLTLLQQRLSTTLKDKLAASVRKLSPTKARKAAHVGRSH
jgi:DNA topoisomerase I